MASLASVGVSGAEIWRARRGSGLCLLFAGCVMPALAVAEGAVQQIACQASTVCDAGGACTIERSDFAFTLSPVELGEHGEGRYRIAYGDVEAEAIMRPDMSLIWAEGRDDLQMLTLLDPTRAILVQRSVIGTGGDSTVTFLVCGEGL